MLYTCSKMSYTSVLVSVYILYTEGVMRYTGVAWKQQVRILVKEPDPTKDGFVQPTRQKRFDS